MTANSNLHKAKTAKNDEFYTQLADISNELQHYEQHFRDKIIFCNCDDPVKSNFWRYFHQNFERLGLKKLVSTHYDPDISSYKMIYSGGNDNDINAGVIISLAGNGDFRNQECLDLLDACDIIITNPPFSLAREYLNTLVTHDKKFLIIGDLNWVTYKDTFPLLKNNQVWLGYNYVKAFIQPSGSLKKFGNKLWFTNLDIPKRHEKLILREKYTPEKYPKYDNYDAINVNRITDIPVDYNDTMGVPITFLDKYNPEQFELLGYTSGRAEFDKRAHPIKRYIKPLQHDIHGRILNGGKVNTGPEILVKTRPNGVFYTADNADGFLIRLYDRLLIRKKADI